MVVVVGTRGLHGLPRAGLGWPHRGPGLAYMTPGLTWQPKFPRIENLEAIANMLVAILPVSQRIDPYELSY